MKVVSDDPKTKPIETTHVVEDIALEHADTIRDVRVVQKTKLTFSNHINIFAEKANRAIGVVIWSFQLACLSRTAAFASFCSIFRSILGYSCVIWGGTTAVHTDRLERMRQKFLVCFNVHFHNQSPLLSLTSVRICSAWLGAYTT